MGGRQLRGQGHRVRGRRTGGQDRRGPRRAPRLAHVVDHRRCGRRCGVDGRARAAARAATTPSSSGAPRRSAPRTPASSSTRRARRAGPKGVVLTNKGFAAGRSSAIEMSLFGAGRRRLPLPPAGPRVRPADPGRLHRGRRRRSPIGAARAADRRRARPGPSDGAAVGAAHLREGVLGGHGHGPAGWRGGRGEGDRPRPQGAPGARAWRGGQRRGGRRVRAHRRRDVRPRARHLRRPHHAGHLRCRADRPGDPRVLLRRRRAGVRGMGDDRDDVDRHAEPARRLTSSARSASRSPAPTFASPRTARSRWPGR